MLTCVMSLFRRESNFIKIMEMQLSIALFVCLLHCSFAEVTEGGPDEFCDEGPPGKYCLPDLSGWHNCYVDPSTGKMVDKISSCAENTR